MGARRIDAGGRVDHTLATGAAPVPTRLSRLRDLLPEGRLLPDDIWHRRHTGVLVLLWAHGIAIPLYALVQGFSAVHAAVEGAIVPTTAAAAMLPALSRRTRTVVTSIGLLSSSAVLVHLSGGLIEMHFHFFVMVAVVALYQDWTPFLTAIGYVFVHHGLMGAIDADSVYNHAPARNNPWLWAAVHAFFVSGISAACLVTWRLNERMLADRRRAEERLREESRITASLHDVGKALSADLDIERVVQAVTDAATELTDAEFGAFFYNRVGDDGEDYLLYTLSGASKEAFDGFGMPRNTPIFGPTFSGEAVVRLDDVTQDPRYGRMAPHHGMPPGHLPVRSYLAVPVRSRTGAVVGGLFFGHQEPGRFTEVDERIVDGIAAQATIALDNARLYESERDARAAAEAAGARLAVLADASRILTSSLEAEAILRDLGALVAPAVAAYCAIDVLEDGQGLRRLVSGSVAPDVGAGPPSLDDARHPVVRALTTGTSQVVDPAAGADGQSALSIVVPMIGRHAVLGALTLGVHAGSRPSLSRADVPFAEELARRAASAIDNARLYAHQRTVAETLQHSLLPERLPDIPGIEAAARYMAGGPGVEVGGDWYDVLQLPSGELMVAIGDVVGRGERAASLMGQLRNAVRAYAMEGKRPRDIADCVNVLILGSGQEHMATLVIGLLDPETGDVVYVSAGHPPPLVVRADGSAVLLDGAANGLPVGAFAGARYADARTRLGPGDTLVLYTDGLVEERSEPLEQGLARLRTAAGMVGVRTLDELCGHIVASALHGRDVQDDVAVLAVRLLPLGDHVAFRLPAEPSVLAPLRAVLRRWLSAVEATEEERYELLVACGEACSNAIRHGAGAAPAEFEVDAVLDGDITITVRDNGRWRPARPGVGGRGLSIIAHYVDDVDVRRGVGGTEVRMRRRLGHAPVRASTA
ncbi:MAG: SpoIIE family protein phosphatase [Actinobacteria bacterium]|nr:SpoIIE family protein phosphatase [Actinomycetota bacterium]